MQLHFFVAKVELSFTLKKNFLDDPVVFLQEPSAWAQLLSQQMGPVQVNEGAAFFLSRRANVSCKVMAVLAHRTWSSAGAQSNPPMFELAFGTACVHTVVNTLELLSYLLLTRKYTKHAIICHLPLA